MQSHARGKHDVIVTLTSETYSSWCFVTQIFRIKSWWRP